jgi:hypothetical protein
VEGVSNSDAGSRELMYFPWLTIPSAGWLRHAALYWDGIRLLGDEGVRKELAEIRPEMELLQSEGLLTFVSLDALVEIERGGRSEERSRERQEILESPRGIAFLNSPAAEAVRERMAVELTLQRMARSLVRAREAGSDVVDDITPDPKQLEITKNVQQRAAERFGVPVEQARRILIARMVIWSALCIRDFCGMQDDQLEPGTDYLLPGELLYSPLPSTHASSAIGLSLANILPQPVPDAPMKQVLRLKSKHRLEYFRFRSAIHELGAELSRAASESEFRHVLGAFGDELSAKRIELEKRMRRAGVDTVLSMVKAVINSAPSELMMSLGVEVWGQVLPLGVKAAAYAAPPVIAVLKQGYASWKESRETVEGSEVGYLFHAKKMGLIGEREGWR